jgi:AcrR family transcriptional regulator
MRTEISETESRRAGRPIQIDIDRLLDTAEADFAEKGFHGTTLRQIAKRAKCNVALISYHFGGKAGLYDAILVRHFQRVIPNVFYDEVDPPRIERSLAHDWSELNTVEERRFCALMYDLSIKGFENPRMHKIMTRELMSGGRKAIQALKKTEAGVLGILHKEIGRLIQRRVLTDSLEIPLGVISLFGPVIYCCCAGPVLASLYDLGTMDRSFIRRLAIHLTRSFFHGWSVP